LQPSAPTVAANRDRFGQRASITDAARHGSVGHHSVAGVRATNAAVSLVGLGRGCLVGQAVEAGAKATKTGKFFAGFGPASVVSGGMCGISFAKGEGRRLQVIGRTRKRLRLSPDQWLAWGGLVAFAAYTVCQAASLAVRGEPAGPAGIVFGVLLIILIVGSISSRLPLRVRRLRRDHPDAFVSTLMIYSKQIRQAREIAHILGMMKPHLWSPTYAAMVVDEHTLNIYGGFLFGVGGRPRLRASYPIANITAFGIEVVPQDRFILPSLHLEFRLGDHAAGLDLCLGKLKAGFPTVLNRPQLETAVAQIAVFLPSAKLRK
jgi:hypothetical protein